MNRVFEIKKLIKSECENNGFTPIWFYNNHLLSVEKFTKLLLKKIPEANNEIVMLGVWLHDLQRIRGKRGEHAKIGANEAEKVMRNFGYNNKMINSVKNVILSHSCDKIQPKTSEGEILATADAMSHYYNDFFLQIAVLGKRDLTEYKKWALEKLNRNYNKKIKFDFAKKIIKERHDLLMELFRMK